LGLNGAEHLTDDGFVPLMNTFTKLQYLFLANCQKLSSSLSLIANVLLPFDGC
jgi:hypothetical protein